ncbi:MAG TPA: tRNA (adenosine(37)-N6)-threonylcarbamoyltransferase complex dimerization subunit type 1 TsaB [Candidatus Saccharimonadales bacterium]|nr:tRNA (adenosine(37)-N6)-threonylcarbamoyltransferase complex dimerization subunit type 1 TsaB [Candidatus Saccharimonadales bacterium]
MLILVIRSDKPEAELGLYDDEEELIYEKWLAHRQLAETIHTKIDELLKKQNKNLKDVQAIVVFKGPGSFTGLRIGITVANAFAYALKVPIVSAGIEDWLKLGIKRLKKGENETIALPEYGSPPNITPPKH